MRKTKALSIMTSVAMTGTMLMSALSFTANAAATNPLGLKLTADKTEFTAADAGKVVTVYVDAEGTVAEADHVGSVEFKIKSDSWGKLDPVNLILSDNNAIATKAGNMVKADRPFNEVGTMVISKWDGADKPKKAGYAIQDYANVDTFTAYSDEYCPAVLIMSDSTKGFMNTASAAGKHIAEFQVKVPSAEGKYTLSLEDCKSMICVDGEFGSNASENVASPTAKSITFTVGGSANNDKPEPTPIVNPGDPDPLRGKRVYDGSANVKVGDAKGSAGETIEVPVYLELGSDVAEKFITGIGFKADYDKTALELTKIYEPDDSAFSDGAFNASTETGVVLYTYTVGDITVDPSLPVCMLQFTVKDGAKDGNYKINLVNHLFSAEDPIQIVHLQQPMKDATYLKPTITQGTVTVGEGGSEDDILWGDANLDGKVNVRDAAFIAKALAGQKGDTLPINADYNRDGKKNVRDAAAIAKDLATGKIKK